ncbi:MAG TPA: VOC family protein [Devosia sp.]|jgi:PhnB protein|nr:VOC family protein [Devosia sp.]
MTSRLNPYLSFKDNAAAAMDFYKSVFGGTLTVMTFGQVGEQGAEKDRIMHSQLDTANGFTLMGSDTPARMGEPRPNGSVSLSGEDDSELRGYWDKLCQGGTVTMPLEKAPWGDSFGMLADKFGTSWLVNIAGKR